MMTRLLRTSAAGLVALAALLTCAAPAGAQTKTVPTRVTSLFTVRDGVAPDPAPRDVDYGQLLTVQTADSPPGVRILEAYRAPLGNTLVPAGAVLVATRLSRGGVAWCHSVGGSGFFVAQGTRYCFEDADQDGRFDQAFYAYMEPGFSRIAYGVNLTPTKRVAFRYEKLTEPGAPPEVLALRYIGPVEGLIENGRIVAGQVDFEIVLGSDRVHLTRVARVAVRLDGAGRGRSRGPLGFEIAVERAAPDGRARVQVVAAPRAGATTG